MNVRLWVFNAMLAALLVLGFIQVRQDWIAFGPAHDIGAIQPLAEPLPALQTASAPVATDGQDWTEIPSRNPFSFDRTDITVMAPVTDRGAASGKPVLFGTLSLGSGRMAMLAPAEQAANRSARPMRVGEVVDGWTIAEILEKSVIVEADGVRETVIMNDPTAEVTRDRVRTIERSAGASPVVRTGASEAPAGAASNNAPPAPPSPAAANGGQQPTFREVRTPFGTFNQRVE